MAKERTLVADSSVVTKWFLLEEGSERAVALRDEFATGGVMLAVPTLLYYEVVNALRFSGGFSVEDLALAAKSLSEYRFQAWRPRGKLLDAAVRMSAEDGVTVYDAVYVALARMKGCRVLTEDRELLEKFPRFATPLSEFSPA